MPLMLRRRLLAALPLLLPAAGCTPDVVAWTTTRTSVAPPAATVAVTPDGRVVPDTMLAMAASVTPPAGPLCPGSLRLAWMGAQLQGVWWAPRSDSGARLLSAHSTDRGVTWSVPVPVDTADRAVNGCRRAPPAIAADDRSGYVHVTYAMLAPEGPGLFFSHSMDRGGMFHTPVPILYGDRLGPTSVAADGDLVVVGFVDPNSTTPRIGLALSRTMGHIFEHRLLPVSDDNGPATNPAVAIAGHQLAVAWEQHSTTGSATALTVRVGTIR